MSETGCLVFDGECEEVSEIECSLSWCKKKAKESEFRLKRNIHLGENFCSQKCCDEYDNATIELKEKLARAKGVDVDDPNP